MIGLDIAVDRSFSRNATQETDGTFGFSLAAANKIVRVDHTRDTYYGLTEYNIRIPDGYPIGNRIGGNASWFCENMICSSATVSDWRGFSGGTSICAPKTSQTQGTRD